MKDVCITVGFGKPVKYPSDYHLFVLLTSGSMFGIWGVFLGIPVYASAKVVIGAIFEWYKVVSGLYEEHNEVEEETHSES